VSLYTNRSTVVDRPLPAIMTLFKNRSSSVDTQELLNLKEEQLNCLRSLIQTKDIEISKLGKQLEEKTKKKEKWKTRAFQNIIESSKLTTEDIKLSEVYKGLQHTLEQTKTDYEEKLRLLESKIQKLNNEQVVLGQKHEFEASDLKLENEQRVKSATENLALALQKVKILEKENSEYKAQVEQKDKELDAGKKKK